MQARLNPAGIKVFLPLKIKVSIQGGNEMDYYLEEMKSFKVIGYERKFFYKNSYQEIPRFWNELCSQEMAFLDAGRKPENIKEETILGCGIGKYGICIDDTGRADFRYLIAGDYHGEQIPEGMTVFEFPELTWAKFRCTGPMPEALQAVNTKIFSEWLPGNPEYEIAFPGNIEWYSDNPDTRAVDYESEIWIPVRRK